MSRTVLTEDVKKEIVNRFKKGKSSAKELAEEHKVDVSTIYNVCRGKGKEKEAASEKRSYSKSKTKSSDSFKLEMLKVIRDIVCE